MTIVLTADYGDDMFVRDAEPQADAAACAALYRPYVRDTTISFEDEPPSADELAQRIARAQERHAWLLAVDDDGALLGYAYGGAFASRAAYGWACEVSVYVALDRHRGGVGRALYAALLPRLGAQGHRRAFAGMTLPNEASAGLHAALGFRPAGVYQRVGFKHGAWHDVAWLQRDLGSGDPEAPPADAGKAFAGWGTIRMYGRGSSQPSG